MVNSVFNNILVSVGTKYISNISSIMRVAALENFSSVDPSDLVNIYGTVVSVPKRLDNRKEYECFSLDDIRVGDVAIFSYLVISERIVPEDEKADLIYTNRIWHQGKEYFAVDIKHLFGIIRDGEIIMKNGYVMTSDFEESKIVVPVHMRRLKKAVKSQLQHIGEPRPNEPTLDLYGGEQIYFNPLIAQKYQVNGKKFCIVQQKKLLGKRNNFDM